MTIFQSLVNQCPSPLPHHWILAHGLKCTQHQQLSCCASGRGFPFNTAFINKTKARVMIQSVHFEIAWFRLTNMSGVSLMPVIVLLSLSMSGLRYGGASAITLYTQNVPFKYNLTNPLSPGAEIVVKGVPSSGDFKIKIKIVHLYTLICTSTLFQYISTSTDHVNKILNDTLSSTQQSSVQIAHQFSPYL